MKIIILGAGQVGCGLAESLATEKSDIVVIDLDEERLNRLQSKLDIACVHGNGAYPNVLAKAGASDADMLIAVTNNDEVNMIACQVAHRIFQLPTKIARIRASEYLAEQELLFKDEVIPVDFFISPEIVITNYIKHLIQYPSALQVLDFAEGKVQLVAIKPYFGGPLVSKSIKDFYSEYAKITVRIVTIYRGAHSIPLTESTTIEIGDEVFFIAANEDVFAVMTAFRRIGHLNTHIMIVGGGNIGLRLAQSLEEEYSVKLIEINPTRAEAISEKLSDTTVLLGDASDKDLLISENIEHVDVFCSLTNDDEDNIMSALLAKRLGAKQVMALVTRTAYSQLIEGGPIDIAISPQQATIGTILTHLRKGDIVNVHALRRGAAEAIELIAHGNAQTSHVVGKPVDRIKLPKNVSIAAIVRGNTLITAFQDLTIVADDHFILLVSDKASIPDIERLFQVRVGYFH